MENIKDLIPQDVSSFLQEVVDRTEGYDVYLGGGCLRDWYYNKVNGLKFFNSDYRVAKDLDIFFVPKEDTFKKLPVVPRTYMNYDIKAADIPNVRENVKSVQGWFNGNLSVRDIQFIEYDKPMSMRELAEDMDCNCNQAMYHPATELGYMTDAFTTSHEDKFIEMLHEFGTERMVARLKRMEKKFPDYELRHNIPEEDFELAEVILEFQREENKRSGGNTGSFICDDDQD